MSLERWFHLFYYLTLGLACSALVFAEDVFLPDLRICLAPVLLLLLLAWWSEGRWSLPIWAANLLGASIGIGGAIWLVLQLSDGDSLLSQAPLQLALLPYMGPLVMAAMVVEVFRPHGPGSFWRVQGIGLILAGLGCVLDGGSGFAVLLSAYCVSALCCLALRYRLSVSEGTFTSAFAEGRWLMSFLVRWSLLLGGAALLLFLITPRRGNTYWEPLASIRGQGSLNRAASTGASWEINLNGTGTIEVDNGIAFRVLAVDASGTPRDDLPGGQRWRGVVLDWYENGKWQMPKLPVMSPLLRQQRELPDFGPGQLFLSFTLSPRQADLAVLAEPLRFGGGDNPLPVITSDEGQGVPFSVFFGTLVSLPFDNRREVHYRQVVPAPINQTRIPALRKLEGVFLDRLTKQNIDGLKQWTANLLIRLAANPAYNLPEGVRNSLASPRPSLASEPRYWEAAAGALTDYLANSGEFTYTLELTRRDSSLDPVMDFLLNVKQGHCERYATALTLMLRSIGIPSRVVKGYRGLEQRTEGVYYVRHSHAHAWVEVVVPHNGNLRQGYDWLTLDPTPSASTAISTSNSFVRLWQETQRITAELWHSLLIDYNAEEQADLWSRLTAKESWKQLSRLISMALLTANALVAFLLLRRLPRRRRTRNSNPAIKVGFYARLRHILDRYTSLRPLLGQTPREYGAQVQNFLRQRLLPAPLAELPARIVALFYRVRFGGVPLTHQEDQALSLELQHFTETMRKTMPRP